MKSVITSAFILFGFVVAATVGFYVGRDYQRLVSSQEFAAQLTTKPLGSEAVGFRPLRELPVLKQIEIKTNGETRRFVVGEIKTFDSSRYGTKSELVMDYTDTGVAEIVRKQ